MAQLISSYAQSKLSSIIGDKLGGGSGGSGFNLGQSLGEKYGSGGGGAMQTPQLRGGGGPGPQMQQRQPSNINGMLEMLQGLAQPTANTNNMSNRRRMF